MQGFAQGKMDSWNWQSILFQFQHSLLCFLISLERD